MLTDIFNHAGGGRMDWQHAASAKCQRLTAQHFVARRNADLTFMSDMLFQWDNKTVRQRQFGERRAVGLGFHFRRMNTTLKIPDLLFFQEVKQIKHEFLPGSPVQEWYLNPTSS